MAQSGTATFVNPDEYGAAIGAARVNIIVTGSGDRTVGVWDLESRGKASCEWRFNIKSCPSLR